MPAEGVLNGWVGIYDVIPGGGTGCAHLAVPSRILLMASVPTPAVASPQSALAQTVTNQEMEQHHEGLPHVAEGDVDRALRPSSRWRTGTRPSSASRANAAPARKVTWGPIASQRTPAMMLAANSAMPVTKLNMPYAVPLSSAGAAPPTSVASSPCENPLWRPQNPTPTPTPMMLSTAA